MRNATADRQIREQHARIFRHSVTKDIDILFSLFPNIASEEVTIYKILTSTVIPNMITRCCHVVAIWMLAIYR